MNDEFVEVISKYIFQDLNGIKKQKPRIFILRCNIQKVYINVLVL